MLNTQIIQATSKGSDQTSRSEPLLVAHTILLEITCRGSLIYFQKDVTKRSRYVHICCERQYKGQSEYSSSLAFSPVAARFTSLKIVLSIDTKSFLA